MHGKNEENLLLRIGLCVGPEEFAAQGVSARSMRAIKPSLAVSKRDKLARLKKRQEILKEIKEHQSPEIKGMLPNFGEQPDLKYEKLIAISIDGKNLRMLGEKIIRGVNYKIKGEFIHADQKIEVYFNEDRDVGEVIRLVKGAGQTFHRGPGIIVSRAEAVDNPKAMLFRVEIWGRLKMNIAVLPAGFMEEAGS